MMKHSRMVLALTTLLWFGYLIHSVAADERFMPYIDWIVENSDMEYNDEPLPSMDIMPYELLQIEVYGAEQVAQAEYQGYELAPVLGGYDNERNRMMFPDTGDVWEMEDVLVHELYHYMQNINGISSECSGNDERPAYEAHWKWVEDHGLQDQFKEPNWLFVFMLAMACQDQHMYSPDSPPYNR